MQSLHRSRFVRRGSKSDPTVDMEWIADTGSAHDLISANELIGMSEFRSDKPVNMITANYASTV